ncbi:MAG: NfeD family protein [bacterium]|nr:NfeD family protein [bacterium]
MKPTAFNRYILPVFALFLILAGWPLLQAQEMNPTPASDGEPIVYVLPFKGEVEIGLVHVLTKGFEEAQASGAKYILLEMDTPGGRVDAALDIVDLMLDSTIPVVVYVKGDATSAGAIISLAADKIFMEQMATIGTASPVLMGGGGESDTMESKALSYVLAKVRTICERKEFDDYKTNLALAMVDKELEVPDPDHPDRVLKRKGIPLTLTAKEALRIDFITDLAANREEVLEKIDLPAARQVYRQELASEVLARFLSSTAVSSLLLTLGFLGIFIEFRSPGFGLPGLLGALALALFFWGHSLAHLGGWEGPLLFMVGVLLLSIEFFVIPGFGFTGIAGFFCIFASIVVTLVDRLPTDPNFNWAFFDWGDLSLAVLITIITMSAGFTIAMALPLLFPVFMKTPVGKWFLLEEAEHREDGYQSAPPEYDALLGRRGLARSTLRPAGIAEIEGTRVDVVSQGGYIEPGAAVEVIKVEGRRIVVRQV